uniref:hypothetical protein n=1 Tax=Leucobacter sp. BZR 635 TaxID=3378705 RepID=UPI003A842429
WLDRAGEVLEGAGAYVSPSSAKIARATGTLVALAERRGASAAMIAQLQEMDRVDQAAARRLST